MSEINCLTDKIEDNEGWENLAKKLSFGRMSSQAFKIRAATTREHCALEREAGLQQGPSSPIFATDRARVETKALTDCRRE